MGIIHLLWLSKHQSLAGNVQAWFISVSFILEKFTFTHFVFFLSSCWLKPPSSVYLFYWSFQITSVCLNCIITSVLFIYLENIFITFFSVLRTVYRTAKTLTLSALYTVLWVNIMLILLLKKQKQKHLIPLLMIPNDLDAFSSENFLYFYSSYP